MTSFGKSGSVLSIFCISFRGRKCHMTHVGQIWPPYTRVFAYVVQPVPKLFSGFHVKKIVLFV
jgi:hypothetical protein